VGEDDSFSVAFLDFFHSCLCLWQPFLTLRADKQVILCIVINSLRACNLFLRIELRPFFGVVGTAIKSEPLGPTDYRVRV
jgi:hypothetical protein